MIKKFNLFKILLVSILSATILMFSGSGSLLVFAAVPPTICNDTGTAAGGTNVGSSAYCQDKSTKDPIYRTINIVVNILTAIAAFVAVVLIVIAGFQMITSSGTPEKISNARNTIIYSAVGLIIIALARIILGFIINKASK